MIIIKSVDRADIFISTKEIAQLNEKMNNVEEHTGFDEVEGDYIRLQPDENSKFELRRINWF